MDLNVSALCVYTRVKRPHVYIIYVYITNYTDSSILSVSALPCLFYSDMRDLLTNGYDMQRVKVKPIQNKVKTGSTVHQNSERFMSCKLNIAVKCWAHVHKKVLNWLITFRIPVQIWDPRRTSLCIQMQCWTITLDSFGFSMIERSIRSIECAFEAALLEASVVCWLHMPFRWNRISPFLMPPFSIELPNWQSLVQVSLCY